MKKRTMKVLSLIVAIVMAISILPLAALAEEVGPKRNLGVVVYGAEFTSILTNVEKGFRGEVDLKDSLEDLIDIATKVADGSGVYVPDVEVTATGPDGKEYKFVEDTNIEIFTETTDIYMPFQDEMDKQLTKLEADIASLKVAMKESNDLTAQFADTLTTVENSITSTREKMETVVHDIITQLAKVTGVNGILYRTYVTEKPVPVGDKYNIYINGFTEEDADGNAVTRDGYIVYNDGLTKENGGSMFNTERSFETEVVEEPGRFDHDILFVGPGVGISGKLNVPAPLDTLYDGVVDTLNTLNGTLVDLKDALLSTDAHETILGRLTSGVAEIFSKITKTEALLQWFRDWNAPTYSKLADLNLSYRFLFPGLWCAEYDAGFSFSDVDVAEAGIAGSEFLMVNRQEVLDVLKFMKDLGKDAFQGALKATFGGEMTYADGTVKDYDSIVSLYTQLIKTEDGQISLDYDTAFAIVKTYIGVISDMNLMDRVVVTGTDKLGLPTIKLRYPIPAILTAKSDENGVVTFTKNSNKTLTWMLQIIPQIQDVVSKIQTGNEVLDLLIKVNEYSAKITHQFADIADKVVNTLVYPFAQRLGLVGKKFGSGEYIMFQYKAGDGYWINPLAYTMIMTWENETWLYATVADLGIIVPYFAEGFYDFVRNTTFAGTIDSFLSKMTGKEVNVITDVLTDKIDITKEFGKVLTGALTAFVGTLGFNSLGADNLYASRTDFINGINQYLYENGRTAQNLMIYLNKQAQRAKSVYAGYVDEDWYFYNLDKSPTLTATKLIDKSTKNIAAAFVNEQKAGAVTAIGNNVSKVVNNIGTKVEQTVQNVKTQIKSTIGAAVKSVFKNIGTSLKNAVTNVFKNLFAKFTGSAMITFNA